MDVTIKNVMNSNPLALNNKASDNEILKVMKEKGLKHMPLIDKEGIVTNLISIEKYSNSHTVDNTVLLMAGGFGKRLHPLTEDIPKPMLLVGDEPILEKILRSFIDQGFFNFTFSLHYKPDVIKDYFGDGSRWGVNIEYLYEKEPLGTAGCLSLIKEKNKDDPIILMNGDQDKLVKIELDLLKKEGANINRLKQFASGIGGEIVTEVSQSGVEMGLKELANNFWTSDGQYYEAWAVPEFNSMEMREDLWNTVKVTAAATIAVSYTHLTLPTILLV